MRTIEQDYTPPTRARAARWEATLAIIDLGHRLGVVLSQEDAARLVDTAIGHYIDALTRESGRP